MKEKLIIRNFGPIKSVELDLGRFNVLIGDQGTGKSTIAKLLTVIQSTFFRELFDLPVNDSMNRESQLFFEYLKLFDIRSYYYENTQILYSSELFTFELKERIVEIKKHREISIEENLTFDVNYIIGERILAITLENSLYGLIETGAYLPKLFLRFGNKFQKARIEHPIHDFTDVIGVRSVYKDNISVIILPSGKEIPIQETSTGIQGTVSLLTVFDSITSQKKNINYYTKKSDKHLSCLIIEEPELHCFPKTQHKLMKHIVEQIAVKDDFGKLYYKNQLLMTTHSPYVLSSLNNLMYAYKVGELYASEADEIIDKKYWLDPQDVCVYMMLPDGTCEDIFDREEGMIMAEKIDSITDTLNRQFNGLLNIELQVDESNT